MPDEFADVDPGAEPVDGDYGGQQPAAPPDISEALGQMGENPPPNSPWGQPQPAEPNPEQADPYQGYDGEPGFDDDQGYDGYPDDAGVDPEAIEQAIDERVQDAVAPIQDALNSREVEQLVQDYPGLQNQATAEAAREYAADVAEALGLDPETASGNAGLIRIGLGLHALEAMQGQQPQQQPGQQQPGAQGQQAHVETGAGPGAPADDMSPDERAYHQALAGDRFAKDEFGYPIQP